MLNERLRKLGGYGLLAKCVYAEVPLRTEYSLTPDGHRLVSIIEHIRSLDDQMKGAGQSARADAASGGAALQREGRGSPIEDT